jgi:hypothetical protein
MPTRVPWLFVPPGPLGAGRMGVVSCCLRSRGTAVGTGAGVTRGGDDGGGGAASCLSALAGLPLGLRPHGCVCRMPLCCHAAVTVVCCATSRAFLQSRVGAGAGPAQPLLGAAAGVRSRPDGDHDNAEDGVLLEM